MTRYTTGSTLGVLLLTFVVLTANPAAAAYLFTDVHYPGAVWTVAYKLNDAGQIVGQYLDASGVRHGFLLSAGTYTTIDCPSPYTAQSYAAGINNLGEVVGTCSAPGGVNNSYGTTRSFRLSDGIMTFLPEAPNSYYGASTFAEAINDAGEIVGWYAESCLCRAHAFRFSAGTYTTIDVPGFEGVSAAYGINNSGQIVGNAAAVWGGGSAHGFLLSDGIYTLLDDPNTTASHGTEAYGINDSGQVVGHSYYDDHTVHGFQFDGVTFTSIDHPDALGTAPFSINAQGQIVGAYYLTDGFRSFVTTTAPSPSITSLTATPNVLWPPNHKMVPVSVTALVSDFSTTPTCRITGVTSSEFGSSVPGETDWVITGRLTLNLRAERAGSGNGRVYAIEVTCANSTGLTVSNTVHVSVPHDQGR